MQHLLVGICVNYAENKLDYGDKFQQLTKLNKTLQMYRTKVKRKALQSLTHSLSSLIECTSFLPTLTFEVGLLSSLFQEKKYFKHGWDATASSLNVAQFFCFMGKKALIVWQMQMLANYANLHHPILSRHGILEHRNFIFFFQGRVP